MIKTANTGLGAKVVGVGFHGGGGKSNDLFHLCPFGYNVIDIDKTGKLSKKINRTKEVKEKEIPKAEYLKKGSKIDISQEGLFHENIIVDTEGYVSATTYYYLQRANVAYIPVQAVSDQVERAKDFLETIKEYDNLNIVITFSMSTGKKAENERIEKFKKEISEMMPQKVSYCNVRFSEVWRTFSEEDAFVSKKAYPNGIGVKPMTVAYRTHFLSFDDIHKTIQNSIKE